MPRKRIAESLTARIFLITAGILLFAGAITFGFIAWATPSTYTAVVNDDLTAQVDDLVERLADTAPEDCGELLDEFVLSSGANAMLVGPDGELVDTGARLPVYTVYEDESVAVTTAAGDTFTGFFIGGLRLGETPKEALDHAAKAAAIAVSRPGAAPSIPDRSEIER